MAKENTNANLGFEKQIWDAACVLWGHIPAAEYRKVIIGLIFLRYISCVFEKKYKQLVEEGDGFEDDRDAYAEDNVFYVPEEARWNVIAEKAHTPEIGSIIDSAMKAIESENSALKNVLPKNYGNPDLDKRVLGEVVDLFTNEIHMDDTEESKDLLGRTYEYCIAQFAEKEGVGGGEYYTPSSIVKLLVEILKPYENCRVYDPCCGSGGMFVQSEKFLEAHGGRRGHIAVYGQEANADTWKMAKINMAIRGIDANFGPYHDDTFAHDLHPTLKADFIMANPPFNYHPWGQENLKTDVRWKYGLPPASNANFAWIQHMLYHLAPNGRIGLVLANGALTSQSGGEGDIRRKIIAGDPNNPSLQGDKVECIISLPPQLFYSVTIPVTLWFFANNKKNKGKVLFIDARKMGYMVDRTHRSLSDDSDLSNEDIRQGKKSDISILASLYESYTNDRLEDIKGFCAVKTISEIAEQDYVLTPGRYVGVEDDNEEDSIPFDEKMKLLLGELKTLIESSNTHEKELKNELKGIGYDIDKI